MQTIHSWSFKSVILTVGARSQGSGEARLTFPLKDGILTRADVDSSRVAPPSCALVFGQSPRTEDEIDFVQSLPSSIVLRIFETHRNKINHHKITTRNRRTCPTLFSPQQKTSLAADTKIVYSSPHATTANGPTIAWLLTWVACTRSSESPCPSCPHEPVSRKIISKSLHQEDNPEDMCPPTV